MLSSISYIGNIASAKSNFSWNKDLDTIFEILSRRFDHFNDNGFYAYDGNCNRHQVAKRSRL